MRIISVVHLEGPKADLAEADLAYRVAYVRS